jgi:small subunit ribosomal protein S19e
MTTIYDVPTSKLIKKVSEELKKMKAIDPPKWAMFVKTGGDREKQAEDEDWWYMRSASILRKIRVHGPIGISRLKKIYGGKKNRGHKPERLRKGSGAVIKNILQQLEEAGFVKKIKEGRAITPKGISFLDGVSYKIKQGSPRPKNEG